MAMTYGGMLYFPFKVSFMDEVPMENFLEWRPIN